jgi:hypothetical protein
VRAAHGSEQMAAGAGRARAAGWIDEQRDCSRVSRARAARSSWRGRKGTAKGHTATWADRLHRSPRLDAQSTTLDNVPASAANFSARMPLLTAARNGTHIGLLYQFPLLWLLAPPLLVLIARVKLFVVSASVLVSFVVPFSLWATGPADRPLCRCRMRGRCAAGEGMRRWSSCAVHPCRPALCG